MAASAAASTYVAGAPSAVRAIVPLRKRVHQVGPHPNQRKAANEILDCFHSEINYCLLRADVQSGKTGTYQYLIRMMLSSGMIDRAYILCGSNELELRKQCDADIAEWHPTYLAKVQKIFHDDFKRERMNIRRALIIVDETHLVCKSEQKLNEFLQSHGLTLGGSTEQMKQDVTYILSVDATPFAEVAAMAHKQSGTKGYVVLENAEGYFGPQHYLAAKLIRETYDIGTKKAMFVSLIKQFPRKYFLVRVTKRNKQYNLLMKACQGICDVRYFTSKISDTPQIALQTLETAPLRTTIVIIDGRLRCGKRVPKKHVAVVWETSLLANTDTIIQGLLGRMSGYQGDDVYQLPWNNAEKPLIFLPPKCTTKPKNSMVNLCDLERAFHPETIPRYSSHIIAGSVQRIGRTEDDTPRYPCVPIQFQLPAEAIARLSNASFHVEHMTLETRKELSAMCLNVLTDPATVNEHFYSEYITDAQRDEISQKIKQTLKKTADPCSLRRFRDESHLKYHGECIEAIRTTTTTSEHIDNCPFLTFCVTFSNCKHPNAIPGRVFAIVYTEAKGIFNKIHLESRIPKQDGKTHFTLSPKMRECPAGMVVGFSPEITENAAIFEKELGHFIKMSQSGIGRYSNKIELFNNNQPLVFLASIYGDNLETFHAILKRLNRQYGINIFYTPQPKTSKDRVIINYIKW